MKRKISFDETIDQLRKQYPQYDWKFSKEFLRIADEIMIEHQDALKKLAEK